MRAEGNKTSKAKAADSDDDKTKSDASNSESETDDEENAADADNDGILRVNTVRTVTVHAMRSHNALFITC